MAGTQAGRADLGVVEQQGIVSGQGHTQAFVEELAQRVLGVLQEQAVVAQRGHSDGHLAEVVEVLEHWTLKRTRGHLI